MLVQKTRKSGSLSGKSRDDDHLAEFKSHDGNLAAKISQVISIALTDGFDQAMFSQAA
jgi:hypothetical protein